MRLLLMVLDDHYHEPYLRTGITPPKADPGRRFEHGCCVKHEADRRRPPAGDAVPRSHVGVGNLDHRLRLAVRLVEGGVLHRDVGHPRLGHRRGLHHHPGPRPRRTRRHVPSVGWHRQIPPLRVRQRRRHLLRVLLLGAGDHRGADRVLRRDAVPVLLLARRLQRRHWQCHRPRDLAEHPAHGELHRGQLPRHAAVHKGHSAITWLKVPIPVLTLLLLFHFHGGNFNSPGGFLPLGTKALFAAIPGAGMIFAYLGFEQADQLAGEIKDPSRNLPRAIITAILLCTAIYVMLQIVFIGALHPSTLNGGWGGLANNTRLISRPLAFVPPPAAPRCL